MKKNEECKVRLYAHTYIGSRVSLFVFKTLFCEKDWWPASCASVKEGESMAASDLPSMEGERARRWAVP